MAVKRWIPKVSDLDGWQGMGEGTDDGYGNAYVHAADYDAQARMLEDAVGALIVLRGACLASEDGPVLCAPDYEAINQADQVLQKAEAQLDEESLRSKP